MKVSEVQIVPVEPNGGHIAFASCVLNDCYFIGSIAIFTRPMGGSRLVFPTKTIGERQIHLHHPITSGAYEDIEKAISEKADQLFSSP